MVANLVIVVHVSKAFKIRFRVAMALMRIAGRIGGFKKVVVVRDSQKKG